MNRTQAKRRRIGPLECIEVITQPDAPYVVLFHGFGADMNDLASLAGMIPVGRPVNWIFPNGHISVPLGPHMEGRAWFPLRVAELELAMASGTGIDLASLVPPGLKRARESAFEMLKALGVSLDRIVLGGFSQGAMLATELALHADVAPAGLAILSGTLVNADGWRELAAHRKGLRFFQAHGAYDPVLKIEPAVRLESLLRDAGLDGKLLKFSGQHEIPAEVLIRLADYLRQVLPR